MPANVSPIAPNSLCIDCNGICIRNRCTDCGFNQGVCLECGDCFVSARQGTEFCDANCNKAFNNRRATRGAELYDLLMALRYDREQSTVLGVWKVICRICAEYRQADKQARDSRRSWQPPKRVIQRNPSRLQS